MCAASTVRPPAPLSPRCAAVRSMAGRPSHGLAKNCCDFTGNWRPKPPRRCVQPARNSHGCSGRERRLKLQPDGEKPECRPRCSGNKSRRAGAPAFPSAPLLRAPLSGVIASGTEAAWPTSAIIRSSGLRLQPYSSQFFRSSAPHVAGRMAWVSHRRNLAGRNSGCISTYYI